MQTIVSLIPLALALLSAIAVLTSDKVQGFLLARGYTKLASETKTAHELAHVLVQVIYGHEHGESVMASAVDASKSPEAQDLLQKAIEKVRGS